MRLKGALVFFSLPIWATACVPAAPANDAPGDRIAEVHARKCGACHSLPAAKSRPRTYVEQAMLRHRRRVRLAEDEWRAMVDYLASPGDAVAQMPR